MSSYSRIQLEKWLREIRLPDRSVIIDIGGSQNPVKGRLGNCGEASEFHVFDLEEPHETKFLPNIIGDIQSLGFIDPCLPVGEDFVLNSKYEEYEEKFDVAFCLEVSEYLYNPLNALRGINAFLKKGGILYISFHFLYPIHNPTEFDFLRYTPSGAEKLLKEAGFEILDHKFRVSEATDFDFYFDLEKMRYPKGKNKYVIGSLIKCKKK